MYGALVCTIYTFIMYCVQDDRENVVRVCVCTRFTERIFGRISGGGSGRKRKKGLAEKRKKKCINSSEKVRELVVARERAGGGGGGQGGLAIRHTVDR